MHIGIDGLHLFGSYGGVQHALARLIEALRRQYPGDKITLFVPRDFNGPPRAREDGPEAPDSPDSGLAVQRLWFPGRWRGIRTLWRNFRLQPWAYRQRCELLHGPTYALPAVLSLPAVVTLHDVIALTHPQFCTPGSARVQKRLLTRSAQVARRIQVPTEAVKREVERVLKADPKRMDVVPWGVGEAFRVIEDQGLLDKARDQWGLPERFVLFVGTLEPKKNIEGLIKSFFAAKMHKKLEHKLVLAGRRGWGLSGLEKLIRELNAREYVLFTGYVPDEALPVMYNLADLCALPSHVEGFGMPVLEAMACGCPVALSADPALVEVGGGAARVCRPDKERPYEALREAFEDLLDEAAGEKARAELRVRGLERAKTFTWERTAARVRKSYERALA